LRPIPSCISCRIRTALIETSQTRNTFIFQVKKKEGQCNGTAFSVPLISSNHYSDYYRVIFFRIISCNRWIILFIFYLFIFPLYHYYVLHTILFYADAVFIILLEYFEIDIIFKRTISLVLSPSYLILQSIYIIGCTSLRLIE
jgi:hypothetical protein